MSAREEAQRARMEARRRMAMAEFPTTRTAIDAWCADMVHRFPDTTRVAFAAEYGHAVVHVGQVAVSATTLGGGGALFYRADGLYAGYRLGRLLAILEGESPPLALASPFDWEGRPRPSEMIPQYLKERARAPRDNDESSDETSGD